MAGTCQQLTFCYFVSFYMLQQCRNVSGIMFQCFSVFSTVYFRIHVDLVSPLLGTIVITGNFYHLLMKCHFYVWTHFYTPKDKNWTVDVKFYHLLQSVAHKQLTTEDCSLSPWTHKYSQYSRWWKDRTKKQKNKKSVSDFYIWKK